jgi:hypothetical protein
MARQALFSGLVYDERDRPVATTLLGGEAHYVVNDDGFLRHIGAEQVDRQVLAVFMSQLEENKELAVEQALRFMGRDDLFTKAAVDASMRNIDINQIIALGIPEQARDMMGLLGLRIVIDIHGDVVRLDQPAVPDEGE